MTDLPLGTVDDFDPVPEGWDEVYENWKDYDTYDDYDDHYSYEDEERDRKLEEDDRFFDRWGYYPDEETAEEADLRIELEEQDLALRDINYQSQEGASTSLGAILYEALTAKR